MKNFKSYFVFAFVTAVVSSCVVPKELQPLVAGEGGKIELLQQGINSVHKSVQWGDPTIAFESVSPKIFPMYYQKMIGNPKTTKVLDITATGVEVDSADENKATSTVDIQVYGAPTYSVRTLSRKESWQFFRMSGGWKLIDVEDAPAATAAN